jgi:hypothetical protein
LIVVVLALGCRKFLERMKYRSPNSGTPPFP